MSHARVVPLVLLLVGCGVPLEERGAELHNSCTLDEECGAGDRCAGGQCVSTRASLGGLLLQVDLPASSPFGAGTSTLKVLNASFSDSVPSHTSWWPRAIAVRTPSYTPRPRSAFSGSSRRSSGFPS